jgi:hypothetical protein
MLLCLGVSAAQFASVEALTALTAAGAVSHAAVSSPRRLAIDTFQAVQIANVATTLRDCLRPLSGLCGVAGTIQSAMDSNRNALRVALRSRLLAPHPLAVTRTLSVINICNFDAAISASRSAYGAFWEAGMEGCCGTQAAAAADSSDRTSKLPRRDQMVAQLTKAGVEFNRKGCHKC